MILPVSMHRKVASTSRRCCSRIAIASSVITSRSISSAVLPVGFGITKARNQYRVIHPANIRLNSTFPAPKDPACNRRWSPAPPSKSRALHRDIKRISLRDFRDGTVVWSRFQDETVHPYPRRPSNLGICRGFAGHRTEQLRDAAPGSGAHVRAEQDARELRQQRRGSFADHQRVQRAVEPVHR